MIGYPGAPLRHFVEDGGPVCYSEPFAADYAGGNRTFEFIAAARADVPALIAALRESRERERRLIEVVRDFLGRDSWCADQHDHADDVNACPCGYAQLRDAFNAARAALGKEVT